MNDVRFALLKDYAKNFDTATEEQADSFIKRWLALQQDNTQLRLKYIPESEKSDLAQESSYVLSDRPPR